MGQHPEARLMKPPICEVCGDTFPPSDGALVSFVGDDASAVFDRRSERPGFVGHPPNTAWFCSGHAVAATQRAATMTLGAAIRDLRPPPPPPPPPPPSPAWWSESAANQEVTPLGDGEYRCVVCGVAFPEQAGAFCDFLESNSVKVKRSLLAGDAPFERPARRWFCPRHIGPAMMVRSALSVDDAPAVLAPPDRAPYEYNQAPPNVAIGDIDDRGEPRRGPFVPMPDGAFDDIEWHVHRIVARPANDVAAMVRAALTDFAAGLDVDYLRATGSTSMNTSDQHETRWIPAGATCSMNMASWHGADLAAFVVAARHLYDGDMIGEHVRLLVQQRESSTAEMVFTASDGAVTAALSRPGGGVMLDRVHVRFASNAGVVLATPTAELLHELGTSGTAAQGVDHQE